MKIIGLTGGIGSGKTTVAGFLAEFGVVVLDADKVGHEAFKPGTAGWRDVLSTFGKEILKADNEIDRKKLSKIVFGKPQALARLNQIMHPRIMELIKERLKQLEQQDVRVAVIEATLLIEADWKPLIDEIWVTIAPQTSVLKRLKERSGYSEEESLSRIRSQMTQEERTRHADVVINTDCTLAELKTKVKQLWDNFTKGA